MSRARISVLIADDEPDVRMLLEFHIELEDDLQVAGAVADGVEVLEHCRQDPPDAIVMDLLMPRMTGLDAIAHLRERHPEIAISRTPRSPATSSGTRCDSTAWSSS